MGEGFNNSGRASAILENPGRLARRGVKLGKRMGGKLILTAFLQASHLGTVGGVPVRVCVRVTERVGGGTGTEGPWRWHRGR